VADKQSTGTQVGDQAVQKGTGRNWDQWFQILDEAGAKGMSHREIVSFLGQEDTVSEWWRQMITVTYEKSRGIRKKHERPDGFQISSSKTVAVGVERLFQMWSDPSARKTWLAEPITIRKATTPRSLRITWADPVSDVSVNFYGKSEAKSQVTLEHSKLATPEEADRMKLFWKDALNRLATAAVPGG